VANDTSKRIFISYSRKDVEFVDRLEKALIARGFAPWVDRRRIEGGDDWLDSIQHAIESCEKVVVILTPDAAESEWVRIEYRYGRSIGKPIIPALLKPVPRVPIDLNHIQWVTSFQGNFETGLNDLLVALAREGSNAERLVPTDAASQRQPSQPDATLGPAQPAQAEPPMSERELYIAGTAAYQQKDLDLAAIYWQRLLDMSPNYIDGYVRDKMQEIRPQLIQIRAGRLREEAYRAHAAGDWAREISTWQALLDLDRKVAYVPRIGSPRQAANAVPGGTVGRVSTNEPPTARTDFASEARVELANAQQNARYAELYSIVRDLLDQGNAEAAKDQMRVLWSRAPYYGDPGGLAARLGLAIPLPYHQEQQKRNQEAGVQRSANLRASYESWKLSVRSEYRRKFDQPGSAALTVWVGALALLLGIGALLEILVAPVLMEPFASEYFSVLMLLAVAVLVYALGFWRALRIDAYLLAFTLAGALSWLVRLGWAIAPRVELASYTIAVLGAHRSLQTDWWQFSGDIGTVWVIILIPVGFVLSVFLGIQKGDWFAVLDDSFGVLLFLLLLVYVLSFIVGAPIVFFGWIYGGLAVGLLVGLITGIRVIFAASAYLSARFLIVLVCAIVLAILQWGIWSWVFGINAISTLEWSIALIVGLLVGGSVPLALKIFITRRDPMPAEYRELVGR
jgi:tetratricopeptide (TPR) repeat protein